MEPMNIMHTAESTAVFLSSLYRIIGDTAAAIAAIDSMSAKIKSTVGMNLGTSKENSPKREFLTL